MKEKIENKVFNNFNNHYLILIFLPALVVVSDLAFHGFSSRMLAFYFIVVAYCFELRRRMKAEAFLDIVQYGFNGLVETLEKKGHIEIDNKTREIKVVDKK